MRLVVFFLGAVPRIDLAGAELPADLLETFSARASRSVWPTRIERFGKRFDERDSIDRYGPLESGQDVDTVVAAWQSASPRPRDESDGLAPTSASAG